MYFSDGQAGQNQERGAVRLLMNMRDFNSIDHNGVKIEHISMYTYCEHFVLKHLRKSSGYHFFL